MAEGGYGEKDTLMEHTDDRNDNADDGDTTGPFQPGSVSTPGPGEQIPRTTTTNRPDETTMFPEIPDDSATTTFTASNYLDKEFPSADKSKIKYKINENGRLQVGLIKPDKPYYYLTTKIQGREEYQINIKLPKEVLKALGPSRRLTLENEIRALSEGINENKKTVEDKNESSEERKKAYERAKQQIERRTDLKKELDRLKKVDYEPVLGETIHLQEFQQHEAERQKREEEIRQERQEQEEIANDENTPQDERQQARERIDDLEQEINEIENEREEEIERLSLTDKLREKVKEIFKKYGFTVTAVLLAVGTTIGVILSSLSNGLKAVAKGVGNGLQTLGKKIAGILPGLLGAIVSFVFRAAGQVISFLGKNAWLLIVGVAVFLFEQVKKRSER